MPSKNNTTRKLKSQLLTDSQVQRIAEMLAAALENNEQDIALITLLFDHLETVQHQSTELSDAVFQIKKYLFVGTSAASNAQSLFQSEAYRNRGKLLQWPSGRKGAA